MRRPVRPVARLVATAVAGASLTGLVGCGSAASPSPPSGIDGLDVPTPVPDPADFTDAVDSPWLGLDVAASFTDDAGATVEHTVSAGPDVAGVPTTAVTLGTTTDLLAQDDDGNVWWLGRDAGDEPGETSWRAGEDGVRAGLLLTATPRLGDGYLAADLPGDDDPRVTVVAVDDDVALDVDGSTTEYDDVVALELDVLDGTTTVVQYARDVGLVLVGSAGGVVELTRAPG